VSRLDLVVGPNGAGKSTFVELILAEHRPAVPFVDADLIAAARWPDDVAGHGYEAAAAAEEIRDALLTRGESFVAETVASHPSKVDLFLRARRGGYHVHVVVVIVPEELAVARVAERVAQGGHDVPEEEIRGRYQRLWAERVGTTQSAKPASRRQVASSHSP
jgi:predicted ABC-type ATPase